VNRPQLEVDLAEIPWCTCPCHASEDFGTPWRWFLTDNNGEEDHLCTDCMLTQLTADKLVWYAIVRAR
jgi:Zn-finger protein